VPFTAAEYRRLSAARSKSLLIVAARSSDARAARAAASIVEAQA